MPVAFSPFETLGHKYQISAQLLAVFLLENQGEPEQA